MKPVVNIISIIKNIALINFGMGLFNLGINNSTIRDLLNKQISENEVEKVVSQITEVNKEKFNLINTNINEVINTTNSDTHSIIFQLDELSKDFRIVNNDLKFIIKAIEDYINLNSNNFLDSFTDLINKSQSFIQSMSFEQNVAFVHISAIIFIGSALFSLLAIYFGEYLLSRFNIVERFPKLGKFIQLRRKFQTFYIIVDSLIILVMLSILLLLNLYIFINF